MRNFLIILLVLTFVFHSCRKDFKLENNQTFNEMETAQFVELLSKFDITVCSNEGLKQEEFKDCYNSFFRRIDENNKFGQFDIGISREQQDDIVQSLSAELQSEVWFSGQGIIKRRFPEKTKNIFLDTIQSISLTQKKYFKFLKDETSNQSRYTNEYSDNLEKAGDISPSMVADIIVNHSKYNIEDERTRLLIAIHYLTLNENILLEKESKRKFLNRMNK